MKKRNSKHLSIGEVGVLIGRVPHTIRQWERDNRLPEHLMPVRDEAGRRWWSEAQVEHLREWLIAEDMRPGKVFRNRREVA